MAQNPNPSHLDPGQIIKRAFDASEDRIRVDAAISVDGDMVEISHIDDSIRIGDGTDLVTTTTVGLDVGLDVNVIGGVVSGEFTQTGLRTQGTITTMDVTNTVTAVPTSPLANRNSLALTNLSTVETLYVGFANTVTADRANGTTAGWEVGPLEGFNLDITDDIVIYARAEVGSTVKIKVMELA